MSFQYLQKYTQSCIGELNKFAVCRCVRASNNARGNYVLAYLITACLSVPIRDIIPYIKVPCVRNSRTKWVWYIQQKLYPDGRITVREYVIFVERPANGNAIVVHNLSWRVISRIWLTNFIIDISRFEGTINLMQILANEQISLSASKHVYPTCVANYLIICNICHKKILPAIFCDCCWNSHGYVILYNLANYQEILSLATSILFLR